MTNTKRLVLLLIVWLVVLLPLLFLLLGWFAYSPEYIKHVKEYVIALCVGTGVFASMFGFIIKKRGKNVKRDK